MDRERVLNKERERKGEKQKGSEESNKKIIHYTELKGNL